MHQTDKTNCLTYVIYGFICKTFHLTLIENITDLIIFVVSNI